MAQVVEPNPEITSPLETVLRPSARTPRANRGVVLWCLGATFCLIASGVVRGVQSDRQDQEKTYLATCPFPLNQLPHSLDGWRVVEGSETVLDPLTTRITGSTDHFIATYVDEMTGVMLSVLVLFGPAEPVMPHTPEVCYPSSGFTPVEGTIDRQVPFGDHETATFRSTVFAKPGGRQIIRNVVYHSFGLNGHWGPFLDGRKLPRKSPGIFKVQIQRRTVEGEKRDSDEPIENFLQKLLPTIERMTKSAVNQTTSAVVLH